MTSGILLVSNDIIGSSVDFDKYYNFLLATLTAIWIITVTGIALGLELIYFMFRFLNIRCYNNCYTVYGILVSPDIVQGYVISLTNVMIYSGYHPICFTCYLYVAWLGWICH